VLRHLCIKMDKAVTEPSPMVRPPEERDNRDDDRGMDFG
jgi:hypothetical protein